MSNKSKFEFLRPLDIFGYKFSILYKGQPSYKTKIGGLSSILSLTLSIASLLYLSQNFIHKTNPRISSRQTADNGEDSFILNNTNFAFAFNIEGLDQAEILSNKWFTTELYFTLEDPTTN